MQRHLTIALALALLGAAACATAGQTGGGDQPSGPQRANRNSDRLTEEEIQEMRAAGATDALTLLQRGRPLWIRARRDDRTGEPVYPLVIYNQQRLGAPATLRSLRAEHVLSMEYFSPARAMGRYGNDGENGVIVVTGR